MNNNKYFISVPAFYDYNKGVVSFWKEINFYEYMSHQSNGDLVKTELS